MAYFQTAVFDTTILEKITKALTWEEYQALSDAEKNNGTVYMISDVNGDGQNFQPVIYSEEEREIGVWTDGKPLYQKTISFGALPSSGEKSVVHGISNLERVVSCLAIAKNASGVSLQIPYVNAGTDRVGTYVTTSDVVVSVSSNLSAYSDTQITLQYTKTADTAGSGTWTPQGVPAVHYSTNEQVVGTWIDGSTVYEKTFYYTQATIPSQDTQVTIADVTSLNIDILCDIFCTYKMHRISNDTVIYANQREVQVIINANELKFAQKTTSAPSNFNDLAVVCRIRYTKSSS